MTRLALEEIQHNFAEVVVGLQPGEVVQIVLGDKVIARLTGEQTPIKKKRQAGSAIGSLTILADDNEHLEDFSDDMP